MDSPWAALVLTGAAVVISVVLLATAAWVFVQAFSWTRSQISKVLPALTPLEVAGGLLATLLLVPEPFVVLLRLVLLLVRTLAYDIPISLINGLAPSCVDTSSLSQMCAGFVTQTANSVWQNSVTRALVLLGENPFSKLGKRGGVDTDPGDVDPNRDPLRVCVRELRREGCGSRLCFPHCGRRVSSNSHALYEVARSRLEAGADDALTKDLCSCGIPSAGSLSLHRRHRCHSCI